MARSRGRRTAVKQSRPVSKAPTRRLEPQLAESSAPKWVLLALVLIIAGCLTVVGLWDRPVGLPTNAVHGSGAPDRTLVCGGGISGAEALSAPGSGTPVVSQSVDQEPVVFNKTVDEQTLPFASLWVSQPRFLAFAPCPEPRADWWFVGVGGAETHPSKLILDNPRSGVAIVNIRALNQDGEVSAPGLSGITVPPGKRRILDLRELTPSASELAVHLVSIRGLVVVTAVDQWSSTVIGKQVSEWVPGQPRASRDLVITGLPAKPDRADLLVANPKETESIVKVRVIGDSGTFSPSGATSLTVPAASVASLNVKSAFDGNPISLRVSSDSPISATVRAVVNQDQVYGQVATGLVPATIAIPPGVHGQVMLSSQGQEGAVQVQFLDRAGQLIGTDTKVVVPAGTTTGVDLPGGAAAVHLSTPDGTVDPEGVIAGVSISRGKGIGGAAFPGGGGTSGGPVVLAGW